MNWRSAMFLAALLYCLSPIVAAALPADSGAEAAAVSGTTSAHASDALVLSPLSRNDFLVLFREETDPDACGAGPVVVRVVHKVRNDADSAVGGGAWANDSYDRYVTIVQTSQGHFCVVTRYMGGFTSDGVKSPGGVVGGLVAGVRGTFSGGYRSVIFEGELNPSPLRATTGNLGIIDYECNPVTDDGNHNSCSNPFSILSTYFLSPSSFDLEWWGWRYVTVNDGEWQNACTGPDPDCPGTVGDILK